MRPINIYYSSPQYVAFFTEKDIDFHTKEGALADWSYPVIWADTPQKAVGKFIEGVIEKGGVSKSR